MVDTVNIGRRLFLGGTGKSVLSATAVALLAGCESMARNASTGGAQGDAAQDVAILNTALGLEHEAIGAYQLGAESGFLAKPVLQTAVLFQSQHKEHRDALAGTIKMLGGAAVDSKTLNEYGAALGAGGLKSQTDVLRLAAKLEKGAANAYLGVIPAFLDPDLAQVSGRLAADETMHWTVLASALGDSLPTQALSFGA
ncbi:ferritin-like domain-containing protein [Pelagibius sp. Alg239-R121]|uniref:ferritin-like domain-containing protein n=1 Tax=Pelagibius sp. Alg239-R121 TaxID=2993448 RepID=UPI0024A692EB|nr:ferritin-like domain-containing protein [Pelagibius sp. Alg239-R121]